MSGYFEIGVFQPKTEHNLGTLLRSAYQLGAAGVFTIGRRYIRQSSDTYKVINKLPIRNYPTLADFKLGRPIGAVLIGIEMGGVLLSKFSHPKTCIYLLGAEDNGLSNEARQYCNGIVSLESVGPLSYNVAVAGSLVMYHHVFG
jgi:tRNA G18 (ribose-2'-O)-methylase SpoU